MAIAKDFFMPRYIGGRWYWCIDSHVKDGCPTPVSPCDVNCAGHGSPFGAAWHHASWVSESKVIYTTDESCKVRCSACGKFTQTRVHLLLCPYELKLPLCERHADARERLRKAHFERRGIYDQRVSNLGDSDNEQGTVRRVLPAHTPSLGDP